MKKSKSRYEQYLNALYSSCCSIEEAIENFCYLNKGAVRKTTLKMAYLNRRIGTLIRKYDPIAFNVGFREYAV